MKNEAQSNASVRINITMSSGIAPGNKLSLLKTMTGVYGSIFKDIYSDILHKKVCRNIDRERILKRVMTINSSNNIFSLISW